MERFLVAVVGFLLISQTSFAREPLTTEEVEAIVTEFQYEGNYKEISSSKSGGFFARCWTYTKVFETIYPGATEPLKVSMTMYIPSRDDLGEDKVPAVIMVPPIGGINLLDKNTAKTLCSYDMAGLIITNDFANIEEQAAKKLLPPEDHQETFYRTAAAIKSVMAFIEDDENLDYSRMGVFGVSLGGILSSFVMATQPDISAGYFVVAGGDIPQILATSRQDEVSRIRRKRMEAEGLETAEEYEAYLRKYITFDPIDMGLTMPPETLNMVISEQDDHVPTSNQEMLHAAFGSPETTYFQDDHVGTVISFLFPGSGRRKVARFFEERFAIQNPRPAAFGWMNELLSVVSF